MGPGAATPQVYAVDAGGGEAQALTKAPEGVFAYEWSPKGESRRRLETPIKIR